MIPLLVGGVLAQSTQNDALCVGGENGLGGSRNFSSSCQPGQRNFGQSRGGATLAMGPRVVDVHTLPGWPTRLSAPMESPPWYETVKVCRCGGEEQSEGGSEGGMMRTGLWPRMRNVHAQMCGRANACVHRCTSKRMCQASKHCGHACAYFVPHFILPLSSCPPPQSALLKGTVREMYRAEAAASLGLRRFLDAAQAHAMMLYLERRCGGQRV
eukprot:365057-Chlamydomonas_euryale.AAC.9